MADPLERLTNLVALLLETRVPLTVEDIANELRGQYPDTEAGRHAAFSRDKNQMRSIGIPLSTQVLTGDQAGKTGYWIARSEFELGDLGLTTEEREALEVAVAAVRLGAGWGDDALLKLGGSTADDAGLAAVLPALAPLPALFEAVSRRCPVSFRYHGRVRDLEPWGLLARGGFWYLVGRDRDTGEQRTFRVDRIESRGVGEAVEIGDAGAFSRPEGFDARTAFPADTKLLGESDGPTDALVAVDAARARAVVFELGERAVVERRADGSVVVRVPCVNRSVFRAWVLGFVEHAEVLGPAEVRAEIRAWLEEVAARGRGA